MIEFIMALPLLAMVIFGIFFFGWAMRNQQRVFAATRYTCWRSANAQDAYRAGQRDDVRESDWDTVVRADPDEVNDRFFGGRGQDGFYQHTQGPLDTLEDFIAAAYDASDHAGDLAEDMIDERYPPTGHRQIVASQFQTDNGGFRKIATRAIREQHARDGSAWRHQEWFPIPRTVPELCLDPFDDYLKTLGDQQLTDQLRRLYRGGW